MNSIRVVSVHLISAEETFDETGQIQTLTLLGCRFDEYNDWGTEFGYTDSSTPYRYHRRAAETAQRICKMTCDLTTNKGTIEKISEWGLDFPTVHPHRHGLKCHHVYGAASLPMGEADPFNAVVRFS